MRIFIVHGYSAGAGDHWFPWLADELRSKGHEVEVVGLPTPAEPVREEWEKALASRVGPVGADTAFVTHSLGTITVLRYLASLQTPWRAGGLVLVSGFTGPLEALPQLDEYLAEDLDPAPLRDRLGAVSAIYSDNDEYVPPSATRKLAEALGAASTVVPGAGHFLGADGHTALPEALEAVLAIAR
ncbi:MAG: RBBP9/YdeN family alpha/beta hydrolase [Segniliparus sp.]|uniref:RBBP9/YdeN family alpha/beta hydrolase n=1 Tax=Segniliparus sp. TaxID=2804064 RepID=UPI003F2E4873